MTEWSCNLLRTTGVTWLECASPCQILAVLHKCGVYRPKEGQEEELVLTFSINGDSPENQGFGLCFPSHRKKASSVLQ